MKHFGFLMRVKEKKTEHSPDYTGHIKLADEYLELAGWVKLSKNGNKYLSITAQWQEKQPQTTTDIPPDMLPITNDTLQDDPLPF